MESLFRSPRLLYRAIEDTAADCALFHKIQSDIVALANSDSGLLKPTTQKESAKHKDYVANKTLLGVVICLAPLEPKLNVNTVEVEPTPIGSIYLTAPKEGDEHHRNSYISIDILAPYQGKGMEVKRSPGYLIGDFGLRDCIVSELRASPTMTGLEDYMRSWGLFTKGGRERCFGLMGAGMIV